MSSTGGTCACISARPGIKYFPLASITRAFLLYLTLPDSPIAVMIPFTTTRSWFFITFSSFIGITFTLVKTISWLGDCAEQVSTVNNNVKMKNDFIKEMLNYNSLIQIFRKLV